MATPKRRATRKRDCFLVGAGFSRCIAAAMPLLADLIPVAERVVGARSPKLLRRLQRLGPNIELWMSYVAQPHPWLDDADALYNQSIFARLSTEIAKEVLSKQNIAVQSAPPTWLSDLVGIWHANRAVVISLNYDTLVEKALMLKEDIPGVFAYQVPVPPIDTRSGLTSYGEERKPTMKLFKLHGSINWYYHGPRARSADIYDVLFHAEWLQDDLKGRSDDIGGTQPLVVPPVLAKDPYFVNDTLHEQWIVAGNEAAGADRLFLLGYSLPTSDQLMRFFLAAAIAPSTVVPVNPDYKMVDSVKSVFPGSKLDRRFVGSADEIPSFVDWYVARGSGAAH
jgi:hypothetical protein